MIFDPAAGATVASHDVYPLFAFRPQERLHAFLGTGFLLPGRILITCRHVVRDALSGDYLVGVVHRRRGAWRVQVVHDLVFDCRGLDLAMGWIELDPWFGFELGDESLDYGADVWTFGYPLTSPPTELDHRYRVEPRYIEGYVTRAFFFEGTVPSYELDMRAPAGLSGAPLAARGSKKVVGVVYGQTESQMIEVFGTVDPETGQRRPDVLRLEHFALAHHTDSLLTLRGAPTREESLGDYVASVRVSSEPDAGRP